jgi:hypothetical protein
VRPYNDVMDHTLDQPPYLQISDILWVLAT